MKNKTQIFHFDLYGKRDEKYDFLNENSIGTINWTKLNPEEPYMFFVPKDFGLAGEYERGFKVDTLFDIIGTGVQTDRDNLFIDDDKTNLEHRIKLLLSNNFNDNFKTTYNIADSSGYKITCKIKNRTYNDIHIKNYAYKPFDFKKIYYDENLISRAGFKVNRNAITNNYIFLTTSKNRQLSLSYFFISKTITDRHFLDSAADSMSVFPLYLYPETNGQQTIGQTAERTPNLNMEIVKQIAEKLGLRFVNEKEETPPNLPVGEEQEMSLNPPLGEFGGAFAERREEATPPNLPVGEEQEMSLNPPLGEFGGAFAEQRDEATPPNLPVGEEQEMSFNPPLGEFGGANPKDYSKPRYITADARSYVYIKEVRDELKKNPTEAENILWKYLCTKQLGHKIRRQHIIDIFITDFVCLRKKVIIEIDGEIHNKQKDYDQARTNRLNELGYDVIRFQNNEVINNPKEVALKIKSILDSKSISSSPETPPNLLEVTPPNLRVGEEQEMSLNPPLGEFGGAFAPIDILDYIYAVLHSPAYREKYKEFLKIDFPRVPYPKKETFWQLVKLGGEIRQIHLLESPTVERFITQYPVDGDNTVSKVKFEATPPNLPKWEEQEMSLNPPLGEFGGDFAEQRDEATPPNLPKWEEQEMSLNPPLGEFGGSFGKVYINETQYFDNVPEIAWNFYIGGYQPAQKWLKDRKGRKLEFEDILHYQKIIVALNETDRLMKEIDKVGVE